MPLFLPCERNTNKALCQLIFRAANKQLTSMNIPLNIATFPVNRHFSKILRYAVPREPKTAEKSNPVKKHDVSEKKTVLSKKTFFFQITHLFLSFFYGFLRINTGFLREKHGFRKNCMKRQCFFSKPRRTRCFHQEPTRR